MEEEKRARAGNRATAECPRKGKAPRMEPPPVVLDADDSGCGGNSSLEVSDPTLAAIRDTDGEECEHMICKGHDIAEIVSKIASSEGTTMCEDETCLATGRHLMMVCSECDSHFCIGRSADKARPRGHIGEHALLDGHWVAVWYEDPYVGYCFECEDSLTIGGEEGKKGMIVKGAEGRRASGFANEHGCVIRGIPNLGNTCYLNAVLQCLLVLEKLWARMSRLNAPLGILGGILHDLFVHTDSVSYTRGLLDPTMLLGCVRMYNPRFLGTFMQDSHELLCCLRDCLDMEEKITRPGNMLQGAPSAEDPTVVDSVFGGQQSVTLSCKCCSFKSVSHVVFHDLSVPLPPKGTPAKRVVSPPRNESRIPQNKTNTEKICAISEGSDPQVPASESEDMVMVKTSEPLKVDSNQLEQIFQSKNDVHGPLQTPIRKENAMIASGHDIERTYSAVLDNVFNGPEVSIEAKMDTFSAEVTTEGKGKARNRDAVYDEAEDINSLASIEECLELHFEEEMIEWRCENCFKVAHKASTISGKDGEQMMSSTNVTRKVDGDQAEESERKTCQSEQSSDLIRSDVECSSSSRQPHGSDAQHQVIPAVDINTKGDTSGMSCSEKELVLCSIADKKPACLKGAQEDVPSCCLAEKQANLFSGQCRNASTQDQGKGKEVNLGHNAQEVEENQYDWQDRKVGAIQKHLISKLPPVLAIHLKRSLGPLKVSGHVSFKEILDVEPFMDPSSEDRDNSSYRLVGVVEHQGLATDIGHYVAYVRSSHQQHNSRSSSWFCASDENIKDISLEEVLKCEAYLLFYERMEG